MMAKNELTPIGDHVLMAFDPIMTTPDITITAGSYEVGTGIIQPVTVTGVSIIMPKKLNSTDLNYKITGLTNGTFTTPRGELQDIADGQESVFIQIDNDGKKYVDLYEGESINLMAFLPPIPQLTGAKNPGTYLGYYLCNKSGRGIESAKQNHYQVAEHFGRNHKTE